MKAAAGTDRGLVRENNEDSYAIIPATADAPGIFIIADGMGGHNGGEIASSMTVEQIVHTIREQPEKYRFAGNCAEALRDLVRETNSTVYKKSQELHETSGMGTTLTMALLCPDGFISAHVGDSRIYLVRSGEIRQLTEDHSYIAELIRSGTISKKEAEHHPRKHVITRAVGCLPEVEPDILKLDLNKDDILILCSDGLNNMVGEEEILRIVAGFEPESACKELIEAAKKNGGTDNVTVIVIKQE